MNDVGQAAARRDSVEARKAAARAQDKRTLLAWLSVPLVVALCAVVYLGAST